MKTHASSPNVNKTAIQDPRTEPALTATERWTRILFYFFIGSCGFGIIALVYELWTM